MQLVLKKIRSPVPRVPATSQPEHKANSLCNTVVHENIYYYNMLNKCFRKWRGRGGPLKYLIPQCIKETI